MIFKMYQCDVGFKYNDVLYDFEDVDSVVIEDPETTKLTRGANARNKLGLVYTEGSKDAKRISVTCLGLSADLHAVLLEIFKEKERCEVSIIDRTDGSSKLAKNCVLCQQPQQLSVDQNAESMNVVLTFETFDLSEVHKS